MIEVGIHGAWYEDAMDAQLNRYFGGEDEKQGEQGGRDDDGHHFKR